MVGYTRRLAKSATTAMSAAIPTTQGHTADLRSAIGEGVTATGGVGEEGADVAVERGIERGGVVSVAVDGAGPFDWLASTNATALTFGSVRAWGLGF